MSSWWWCPSGLAAVCCALALAAPAAAQSPQSLFAATRAPLVVVPSVGAATTRTRRVTIVRPAIERLFDATSPRDIVLNLFDDVTPALEQERRDVDPRGVRTWSGRVAGDSASAVLLTWGRDGLSGQALIRGRAFALDAASPTDVVVRELGAATPSAELAAHLPPAPARDVPLAASSADGGGPAAIDLLVLYTPAAERRVGGVEGLRSAIATSVAATNTAFQRSGVAATITAVDVQELFYIESLGGLGIDLYEISPGGSMHEQVDAARRESGADLVALITGRSSTSGGCGTAYLGPDPGAVYSVTEQACLFAGQWSFTHEIGHAFGADHADGDPIVSPVRYARGYRDGGVRTLMAYPVPGAPARILNFSSASVREPADIGAPTGSSLNDNARRLRETAAAVAAFNAPPVPPSTPTSVVVDVVGDTVSLAWTVPAGGGPAASVELEAGSAPGAADYGRFVFPAAPAVFPGLRPGRYYARLRSRGPGGVSGATPDLVIDVTSTCAPPGPASVAAVVSGSLVTLRWSARDGSGTTTYELGAGTRPGALDLGLIAMGTATNVAVPAPAGTYYVRVAGSNGCGRGGISPELVVTVP